MMIQGEPTYAGVKFGEAYLMLNGERVDVGTMQDFEFIPDPDSGELRSVRMRELLTESVTFTMMCDWDLLLANAFWEMLYPELAWQAFAADLDRRLRWLI